MLNLALVGCERCGIVFSHPLPSDADLSAYYLSDRGWQRRISLDQARIDRTLEAKRAVYARHLTTLERFLGDRGRGPWRAFDFGCGLGAWLDVLKDRGWETCGLEPGERARSVAAQRHPILKAIPEEAQFDLVIVNHVLEHLRDPLVVTQALAGATRPGGHIYVSVPDFGRLPKHRDFGYVKGEQHIFSYTSSSLRSLFALATFDMVAHSNESIWHGSPDQTDRASTPIPEGLSAARLQAVGVWTGRKLELPPDPLAEALASMRGYEAHAAETIIEESRAAKKRLSRPKAKQTRAKASKGGWGRAQVRRIAKRLRWFFNTRLREAVRVRVPGLRKNARQDDG